MWRKLLGGTVATIDTDRWHRSTHDLPFLAHLDDAALARLKTLCEQFLSEKRFSGADGFEIDDDICVTIAIQACLPVLELGLAGYRDFVEIVVYPDRFIAPRKLVDDAGVVHEFDDELAGEAMDGGPVVLSWPDADPSAGQAGWNVVIHEFVHKIDLVDGEADGTPPLPAARRARWQRTLGTAFDEFCRQLEALEDAIPPDVDPESPQAEPWYARLPLDPYAATDPAEFFAVAAEAFFTDPYAIRAAFPALYEEFREFFGQNPTAIAGRGAPP